MRRGQWSPNEFGGNEYLAATAFLKELNTSIYKEYEGVLMIAEESTAFPGVTTPVHHEGLGFGYKWMMGWMNDTLEYFSRDPIHRKYHHNDISRSLTYAFTENYILPLSHDEVVHGKKSLLDKMPGDDWQQFANLRLLYTYMFTHPGQKLLFMGDEFGQRGEWNVNDALDWTALNSHFHTGIQSLVKELNRIYTTEESLYRGHNQPDSFQWIDYSDSDNTVLSYIRRFGNDWLLVVLNFSPVVREGYRIGSPKVTSYKEIFNSDTEEYAGSNILNDSISVDSMAYHGYDQSISCTLPPLGGIILKPSIDD